MGKMRQIPVERQYGRVVRIFGCGVKLSGFTSLPLTIFVALDKMFNLFLLCLFIYKVRIMIPYSWVSVKIDLEHIKRLAYFYCNNYMK